LHLLYLLSVWLHILAAVTYIGGMIFLALVLVPTIRKPEYRDIAMDLVHRTGTRFRNVGWVCLGVLVLTGGVNLAFHGIGLLDLLSGEAFRSSFGHILGLKLLLVAVLLLMSIVHDFVIGPKATAAWRAAPGSPEAARRRRRAGRYGRTALVLSLLVVALGVMLVRGGLL
jgi:putative copper resistance protein D